jgi:hypothetical protein
MLIEHNICYGMEINVKKTEVMRIARPPSLVQIMINQKQLQNMEYFRYLGSMVTNDARRTREIKSKTKAVFKKRKNFFLPANWTYI